MNMLPNTDKRSKAYAYTLMGCILAIALIGLLGIWGIAPLDSTLYKLVTSFVTIGALSGFLFTLNAETDKKISQRLVYIVGGSTIGLALIVLLQIWTSLLDESIFSRIVGTLVVIGLLAAFVMAVFDDFFENKKLKDENYLD
jgi:hypothetical protein